MHGYFFVEGEDRIPGKETGRKVMRESQRGEADDGATGGFPSGC